MKRGSVIVLVAVLVVVLASGCVGEAPSAGGSTIIVPWITGRQTGTVLGFNGATQPITCTIVEGSLPAGIAQNGCGLFGQVPLLPDDTTKATSPPLVMSMVDSSNPPVSKNFTVIFEFIKSEIALTPFKQSQCTVGEFCNARIVDHVDGGEEPFTFRSDTYATGSPPLGTGVNTNGVLTGTPSRAGVYTFGVCVVDSIAAFDCQQTQVTIVEGEDGGAGEEGGEAQPPAGGGLPEEGQPGAASEFSATMDTATCKYVTKNVYPDHVSYVFNAEASGTATGPPGAEMSTFGPISTSITRTAPSWTGKAQEQYHHAKRAYEWDTATTKWTISGVHSVNDYNGQPLNPANYVDFEVNVYGDGKLVPEVIVEKRVTCPRPENWQGTMSGNYVINPYGACGVYDDQGEFAYSFAVDFSVPMDVIASVKGTNPTVEMGTGVVHETTTIGRQIQHTSSYPDCMLVGGTIEEQVNVMVGPASITLSSPAWNELIGGYFQRGGSLSNMATGWGSLRLTITSHTDTTISGTWGTGNYGELQAHGTFTLNKV